jgi:hypothetical protein
LFQEVTLPKIGPSLEPNRQHQYLENLIVETMEWKLKTRPTFKALTCIRYSNMFLTANFKASTNYNRVCYRKV